MAEELQEVTWTPVKSKELPTNCQECGESFTYATEAEVGLCGMCGPGSLRWQKAHPPVEEESDKPRYCRESGKLLTRSFELEVDLHSDHGPGSREWQLRFPEYVHTSENYDRIVKAYRQERLNREAKELLEKAAKKV